MRNPVFICMLFLLFISCSEKEKMKYEKDITVIHKAEKESIERLVKNRRELPEECNLYLMNEYKIKTSGLSLLSPKKVDNYVYGEKTISDYKLILYSNEYPSQKSELGDNLYEEITGFILLSENQEVRAWIQVFYSGVDAEEVLYPYLYDKYIIIIKIIDHNYDIMNESKEDDAIYSFVVTELTKDGDLKFLEEQEGRKIAKKYLSSHKTYQNRF